MKKSANNIFKNFFCFVLVISSFFCNSGFPQSAPLTHFGSMVEPFKEKGLHITAKAYTSEESKTYLDQNLLKAGFQPVQITIQNNTERIYILSRQGIDTPIAQSRQVATSMTMLAIPRSIGLKVASLFFWPFAFPSTIDSILTVKSHQKMKRDFQSKAIKEYPEYILQYSTLHRVIFLPRDPKVDTFTLHLIDYQTQQMQSFPIKI